MVKKTGVVLLTESQLKELKASAMALREEIRERGRIFFRPQQANELAWLLSRRLVRSLPTMDGRCVYFV